MSTLERYAGRSPLFTSMPTCDKRVGFLTDNYVHVFAPPDLETVCVCPCCGDKVPARGKLTHPLLTN